jgi:hypothetical protein
MRRPLLDLQEEQFRSDWAIQCKISSIKVSCCGIIGPVLKDYPYVTSMEVGSELIELSSRNKV